MLFDPVNRAHIRHVSFVDLKHGGDCADFDSAGAQISRQMISCLNRCRRQTQSRPRLRGHQSLAPLVDRDRSRESLHNQPRMTEALRIRGTVVPPWEVGSLHWVQLEALYGAAELGEHTLTYPQLRIPRRRFAFAAGPSTRGREHESNQLGDRLSCSDFRTCDRLDVTTTGRR